MEMKSRKVLGLLRDSKAYVVKHGGGKVWLGTESRKVRSRDNSTIRLGLKCGATRHIEVSKG